jgi:murein DD-endopeptidase MepM/ murein hydrolase activator NlpD
MINHYNFFKEKTPKQLLLLLATVALGTTLGVLVLTKQSQEVSIQQLPLPKGTQTSLLEIPAKIEKTPPTIKQQPILPEPATISAVKPEQQPALPKPVELSTSKKEVIKDKIEPQKAKVVKAEIDQDTIAPIERTPAPTIEPTKPTVQWQNYMVKEGDSLTQIFRTKSFPFSTLHQIVNSSKIAKHQLSLIRPGQTLRFRRDSNGELRDLVLIKNPAESLRITANDEDSYDVELVHKTIEKRIVTASGLIESSLFSDAQKAGLSDNKTMELAKLFRWDIDFALEIRAGDHFRVLYEEHYLNGKKLRDGPILAAEFVNRGKTYQAFRFEDKDQTIGYYDAKGRDKRRAFIRTPIKFARISSRFSKRRWHPVLKRWRSHKGVDYAAPTGTPIKATGYGKVTFRGWKSGYGHVVIVQHGRKYQTVYAHMSKYARKVKVGSKVKQGQVIGYVGQSGLATGPHLHYEFRVNGTHRNPLTVKLPKSLSLGRSKLAYFKKQTAPLLTQLAAIKPATLVASNTVK